MVRLKHANDEKSTTGGGELHTFITLSAKKFLRALFVGMKIYLYICVRFELKFSTGQVAPKLDSPCSSNLDT